MNNLFKKLEDEILENSFTEHSINHKYIRDEENEYDIIVGKFDKKNCKPSERDFFMNNMEENNIDNAEMYNIMTINSHKMYASNGMSYSIYCFNNFMNHKIGLLTTFKNKNYADDMYEYKSMFMKAKNNKISFIDTCIHGFPDVHKSVVYRKGKDAFIFGLRIPQDMIWNVFNDEDDFDVAYDKLCKYNKYIIPQLYCVIIIDSIPYPIYDIEQIGFIFRAMKDDENFNTLQKYFEVLFKDFEKMTDEEMEISKKFLNKNFNSIHNDVFNDGNVRVRMITPIGFNYGFFNDDAKETFNHDKSYFHSFSKDDEMTYYNSFEITGNVDKNDMKAINILVESLIHNYPTVEQYKANGFKVIDFKNGKVVVKSTKEENNNYFVNSITGFTNIDLGTAKWETRDNKKLPKNSLYRRTIALHDEYDKYITTMSKMRGTDVKSLVNSLIKKENQ
jgi:hypothetical protein